ncbi:hypothetical protein Tco_0531966 [Tanacetum coccineum]
MVWRWLLDGAGTVIMPRGTTQMVTCGLLLIKYKFRYEALFNTRIRKKFSMRIRRFINDWGVSTKDTWHLISGVNTLLDLEHCYGNLPLSLSPTSTKLPLDLELSLEDDLKRRKCPHWAWAI